MWQAILGFLGGPLINGLLQAFQKELDAKSQSGAQAADVVKAALIAQVEAKAQNVNIITAMLGKWYLAIPMVLTMGTAALYFFKAVGWDKVLAPVFLGHTGNTDPLGGDVQTTYNIIISFWFGGAGVSGVVAAVRTWWR